MGHRGIRVVVAEHVEDVRSRAGHRGELAYQLSGAARPIGCCLVEHRAQ
jgi:hypothetical protein